MKGKYWGQESEGKEKNIEITQNEKTNNQPAGDTGIAYTMKHQNAEEYTNEKDLKHAENEAKIEKSYHEQGTKDKGIDLQSTQAEQKNKHAEIKKKMNHMEKDELCFKIPSDAYARFCKLRRLS